MASPTTAVSFLDLVCKSGLLTQKQVDEVFGEDAPPEPNQCAAILVKSELITQYQAKQLLAGKFRGFFLGPYKILRSIGQGGMGVVYLAEHTALKRKVAVKVLTAEKAKDKLTLERFNREARAAAALDHPNIVHLHDISQGAGVHFLVMEFVEGNDLQSLMAQTGPLHFAQAAQYVAQAAAGLQHAHDKGIIHRDIKPANLMLTKDGRVKILDMGLARSFTDAKDNLTGLLAEGDIAGTIDFLSPEQAMNHPLDERSDIYSLGATFYALVTGHPPFNGSTAQKLMQHQLKEPATLSVKLRGQVPPALSDVIHQMMAKRPSERYQSCQDVIDALGPWLPAVTSGSIVTDPFTASSGDLKKMSHTRDLHPFRSSRVRQTTGAPDSPRPLWKRPPVLIGGGIALVVIVCGLIAAVAFGGGKTEATNKYATGPNGSTPPIDTNTQSNPTREQKTTPPRFQPAPRTSSKTLYAVDFASTPPASRTVTVGGRSVILTELSGTPLPPGVVLNHWNSQTSAVYSVGDHAAVRALGMQPTGGNDGVQAHFKCDGLLTALAPGGEAKARITYALDGSTPATAFFELRVEPYAKYDTTPLPVTGGQWKTVDLTFTRPPENGDYELVVKAGRDQVAVDGTLRVKSIEVSDPTAADPGTPNVYRLDTSKLKPFRQRIDFDISFGGPNVKTQLPGWQYEVYEKASYGEASAELIDGRTVIAVGSRSGKASAQFSFQPVKIGTVNLVAGREYEARLEYMADADASGIMHVQTISEWKIIGGTTLPATSTWKTVTVPVIRPEGKEVQFTFGTSNLCKGFLKIRSFEIIDPTAAVMTKPVFQFDLSATAPFRKKFQDGMSEDGGGAINVLDDVFALCWKKTSVAEFRCEAVDGKQAVGVTNLNDDLSSQIGFHLKSSQIAPGKKYVARVEYLTQNEAVGELVMQTQGDYRRFANQKLATSGGKWATVDVPFVIPAETTATVIIENQAVGEGNTLLIRRVEVHEAK